jgi:hypothetical protein
MHFSYIDIYANTFFNGSFMLWLHLQEMRGETRSSRRVYTLTVILYILIICILTVLPCVIIYSCTDMNNKSSKPSFFETSVLK